MKYISLILGNMYTNGRGALQDDKQALHWYTTAAEQGYVKAQFSLGVVVYFACWIFLLPFMIIGCIIFGARGSRSE